jgi:ABC-2 type transport system permease protein
MSTRSSVPPNPVLHAVRLGVRRGWAEFVQSLRSSQDQWFYLFTAFLAVGYLYLRRDTPVDDTGLLLPSVALPSILAGLIAFGLVIGPAYSLAMEKEDGTLLRARATPNGLVGYVVGQVVYNTLSVAPLLAVVLVPSVLLFEDVPASGERAWLLVGLLPLAVLATLPIGLVIGALCPSTQKVSTFGMLPVLVLAGISGIFVPITALWGWVQVVAQIFPMYWVGLGMRAALLPDSAVVVEIGESWRLAATFGVLGAWAVLGLLVLPPVLRRMARRQSGAAVAEARERAVQVIR